MCSRRESLSRRVWKSTLLFNGNLGSRLKQAISIQVDLKVLFSLQYAGTSRRVRLTDFQELPGIIEIPGLDALWSAEQQLLDVACLLTDQWELYGFLHHGGCKHLIARQW